MKSSNELKQIVRQDLRSRREEILQLCSDLVKIPSENPPGDMGEISDFLQDYLEKLGFRVNRYEPLASKISLVARIGNDTRRRIILNGHMDVVPAGDRTKWNFDPYSGERRSGKILGRGATDMKGGLTGMIAAFMAISKVAEDIDGCIDLALVPDEETGGQNGTGWLLRTGNLQGSACIIGEPARLDYSCLGEKGACWLRLSIQGKPAHGSWPMIGKNAVEQFASIIPNLHQIEVETASIPADLTTIIEESQYFYRTVFQKSLSQSSSQDENTDLEGLLDSLSNALDHPTLNLGLLTGGTKINVVPDRCEGELDIRVPVGMTAVGVKNRLLEIIDRTGLADYDCVSLLESNPNYTSPNEWIFQCLQRSVKEVVGLPLKALFATGFTDGKHFRNHDIPTITYGPGEVSQIHSYNEFVNEEEVLQIAEVYALTLVDYFSHTSDVPYNS